MKLDKDLIRSVLLAVESYNAPRGWVMIEVHGHTDEEIAYHVEILAEAGFIEADNLSSLSSYDWRAKRLTYQGHEFLDTIRDSKVWSETKKIASTVGAGSVTALFEIGKAYIKQQLLLSGVHLP
jgi:hypothetical protein